MNLRTSAYIAGSVALLMLSACGKGDITKSTQVLARVGDKEITTTYFDRQLANLPESVQKLSQQGKGKRAILDALVSRELLYADAVKNKLDKNVELQRTFEDLKKELIIKTYLQQKLKDQITVGDNELIAYYNSHSEDFKNRHEVRISQILVPDEAAARQIQEKLSIKRDFAELAEVHSSDKESAARKGDVGWFTYKHLPAEVRDSVFKMGVGDVSQPFKMPDGYEIYKITDKRVLSATFPQAKNAIKAQLYNEKMQKQLSALVDRLKKESKIQVNEGLLK